MISVRCLDDVVVPDGTSRLSDVLHAGLSGTLNIVAEGEESIGTDADTALCCDPGLFLCSGQRFGPDSEGLLPGTVSQNVVALVGKINVDGIIAVRSADTLDELQGKHLRVLAEKPVVCLLSGQPRAVDAALLPGTDAHSLSVPGFPSQCSATGRRRF